MNYDIIAHTYHILYGSEIARSTPTLTEIVLEHVERSAYNFI